jgi:hypothetical protein
MLVKEDLHKIYESLAAEKKAVIQETILKHARARERSRLERVQELEAKKQEHLQQLETIDWTTADNDQWFRQAKIDPSIITEEEYRSRLAKAKELHYRRKAIVETILPALKHAMRSLLQHLEIEELQEKHNQALDLEQLLAPIIKEREAEISHQRYLKRREQQKAIEQEKQEERRRQEELQLLSTQIREFKEQLERERIKRARRVAINYIRALVRERKIPYLVHFTPKNNLDSILSDGLLSRNALIGRQFTATDEHRTDGWLDWISLSLSFPNYKMFYPKRNQLQEVDGWVVLLIRSDVLWELECKYFLTNAASSEMRAFPEEYWSSCKALKDMFGQDEYRKGIPTWYTTDPQAEVMVKEQIPINFIRKVVVASEREALSLQPTVRLPVEADETMFKWREDFMIWKDFRLKPENVTTDSE